MSEEKQTPQTITRCPHCGACNWRSVMRYRIKDIPSDLKNSCGESLPPGTVTYLGSDTKCGECGFITDFDP